MTNRYHPLHVIIFNGYHIHKWLKGNVDSIYSETPEYNFFICSYSEARLKSFKINSINRIPEVFASKDVLWIGSYLVQGTNSAKDLAKNIKRYS